VKELEAEMAHQENKIISLKNEIKELHSIIGTKVGSESFVILNSLVAKLKAQLECPINYSPIENPVILKSGITVDENTFDKLDRDPFDNTKKCDQKIKNLFFKEIKEITSHACEQISQIKSREQQDEKENIRKRRKTSDRGLS
jgi:hypothetical protein